MDTYDMPKSNRPRIAEKPPLPLPRVPLGNHSQTLEHHPSTPTRQLPREPAQTPPPKYTPTPPIPDPIISGYLEKSTTEEGGRGWVKKYVEVAEGKFRFYNSREEKMDAVAEIVLGNAFVSVQSKRQIRVDSSNGVRVFRAASEALAYRWFCVIARHSKIVPTGECWCKKLSGSKKIFEERHLRLSADGRLSWYKSDSEDAQQRGFIQVRGEGTSINPELQTELWVQTKERQYQFQMVDREETSRWFGIVSWHSHRLPMEQIAVSETAVKVGKT